MPASDQCVRMVLDADGISHGWRIERLPDGPRIMGECVHTPDGKVVPMSRTQALLLILSRSLS